jgi:hypothetical protein
MLRSKKARKRANRELQQIMQMHISIAVTWEVEGRFALTVGRKAMYATIKVAILPILPPKSFSWKNIERFKMTSKDIGKKRIRNVEVGCLNIFIFTSRGFHIAWCSLKVINSIFEYTTSYSPKSDKSDIINCWETILKLN